MPIARQKHWRTSRQWHPAGFSQVEVHWEGTELETGEGNGVYRKTDRGEAIESWVAYIIALP